MTDRTHHDMEIGHADMTAPVSAGASRSSHSTRDSLFGKGVFISVVVAAFAILTFFGSLGYRVSLSQKDDRQSIGTLVATDPVVKDTPAPTADVVSEQVDDKATPIEPDVDKSSIEIVVLNGGATAGAAGKGADILKKAGFTGAKTADATLDYSGVTVYHKEDASSEAEMVRKALADSYKSVSVAPADAKKAETGTVRIVVVIGK